MKTFSHKTSGFSLVEISLAIVVIAIGLSVVVMMFPAGLNQNAIATGETQAAQFAEDVFNSLQTMLNTNVVNEQPWSSVVQPPFSFEDDAQDSDIPSAFNANPNTVLLDGGIHLQRFERQIAGSSFDDSALRYRIDTHFFDQVLKVKLSIWPGEWGSTGDDDALTFYTEMYYPGL